MVSEPIQDIEMNDSTPELDESHSKNHQKSESIHQFLKQLQLSTNSTKKQEQALEKLIQSPQLLEKYLQFSPDLKEIFKYLDETNEAFNELSNSSIKLNINETNADVLFECIEKSILLYQSKFLESGQENEEENINYVEIKKHLNDLCSYLIKNYLSNLITKCLLMKSTTKKTLKIQETLVRLLTLCVSNNVELAKLIALEYNYFNDFKNWLERFLFMKQTDLREISIKFLLSFLKHIKIVHSNEDNIQPTNENDLIKTSGENRELLFLIKKIFLNTDQDSNSSNKKSNNNHASSSLILCLFLHVQSDSRESIEFMLQELLFRFIQNDSFNKSEKVRLFNEKTLSNLIKIFEWKNNDQEDQTLIVREVIGEFLKILFCSTRYGISFYDKTLNIGESQSNKNYNHLIFNALINIPRYQQAAGVKTKITQKQLDLNEKTNTIIDQLVLRTLKVCPDLIQRYLKVRQKQEQNLNSNSPNNNDENFIKFCIQLFDQQHVCIRNMRKNYISTTSFMRSLVNETTSDLKSFLCQLIIHTSLPLCFLFQKLFQQNSSSTPARLEKLLKLVTSCLNCLKEWKECLKMYKLDYESQMINSNESNSSDLSKLNIIYQNLTKIMTETTDILDGENIFTKINLELLTKYLPKLDLLINQNLTENSDNIMLSFDIFNLYFDIFMNDNENSECLSLLQLDSLENNLIKLIPKLLDLNNSSDEKLNLDLCIKYLKFFIKYLHLKQQDDFHSLFQTSLTVSQNLIDLNLNKTNQFDHKNLNLFNLVKIMFKYNRDESNFQSLIEYYLNIIGVYLNESKTNTDENDDFDFFKYDKYTMYLWFLLVKKKFNSIDSENVNLFKDYIYVCLFNLLDSKQRNLIIQQLKLNNFNQILIYICLKAYFILIDKFTDPNQTQPINEFLFDYIFSYGLTISSHTNRNFFDLNHLFQLSISDNETAKQSHIDQFVSKLKESYNDINNLSGKKKVKTICESYMKKFEKTIDLKPAVEDDKLLIPYLNLNLRVRHLLFLLDLFKNDTTKNEDMKLVLENLKHCLNKTLDLSKLNYDQQLDLSLYRSNLLKLILNNLILTENVFKNDLITQNVYELWSLINNNQFYAAKYFQVYLNIFLDNFEKCETKENFSFISELTLELNDFKKVISKLVDKLDDESNLDRYEFFVKILIKNQEYLFENDLNLLDELNSLEEKHIVSLEMLSKCLKALFLHLHKVGTDPNENDVHKFLIRSYEYKPILFKIIFKVCFTNGQKLKLSKCFKKFVSNNDELTNIINKCLLKEEIEDQDQEKTKDEDMITLNEAKLLNDYKYTLSKQDQNILRKLYKFDSKLESLKFKLDNTIELVTSKSENLNNKQDYLNKQAKISDFITTKLNESVMISTIRNYPIERKMNDLVNDKNEFISLSKYFDSKVYDPIYLLPNMFNLLDYSNIVDLIQFLQSKCLSLLMASLSSECQYLRLMSYGCIYRFLSHLESIYRIYSKF